MNLPIDGLEAERAHAYGIRARVAERHPEGCCFLDQSAGLAAKPLVHLSSQVPLAHSFVAAFPGFSLDTADSVRPDNLVYLKLEPQSQTAVKNPACKLIVGN